jgi:hypothetical protein
MKNNERTDRLSVILGGRLNIIRACQSAVNMKSSRVNVLCDQVLDSIIVGGITGVSAYIYAGGNVSVKAAVLSFLLTFLIKMKEYRKIT